jgi:hypothetical protein
MSDSIPVTDEKSNVSSLSSLVSGVASRGFSRRRFMSATAVVGASLAFTQLIKESKSYGQTVSGGPTDGATQFAAIPGSTQNIKVLNFALTLEILEADLYRQALNIASGLSTDTPLSASPSTYTLKVPGGGLNSTFTAVGFLYLKQFAYVEAEHRQLVTSAIESLGGTPVSPNPGGYKFPDAVEANMVSILGNILPLEETGVRAYLGAINYINDLSLATTAGTIYSTECRHSSVISYTLGIDPGPRKMPGDLQVSASQPAQNTFEYYLKPLTVISLVPNFYA